jgi:hypothetical protein
MRANDVRSSPAMRTATFVLVALFASVASATHACNSGWDTYAAIPADGSFPIYGCDGVYADLMKVALAKKRCTLKKTRNLLELCYTTSPDGYGNTCRGNGDYAFGSIVELNCKDKQNPYVTHAIVSGTMKSRKFVKADVSFYDHEV